MPSSESSLMESINRIVSSSVEDASLSVESSSELHGSLGSSPGGGSGSPTADHPSTMASPVPLSSSVLSWSSLVMSLAGNSQIWWIRSNGLPNLLQSPSGPPSSPSTSGGSFS